LTIGFSQVGVFFREREGEKGDRQVPDYEPTRRRKIEEGKNGRDKWVLPNPKTKYDRLKKKKNQ